MPDADLDQVRIHYQFDGPETAPVVVLSNSLGCGLRMWDRVMPAFTQQYRVLRYDTRGQGASSVPQGPYTLELLAHDVLSLLSVLGIEHCFFCGLSLGGMTGIWLGIHAQDRVRKLVLANTAARIGTVSGWNDRIRQVEQQGVEAVADNIIERWFSPAFHQSSPEEVQATRAMLAVAQPYGIRT
jgi:3-oxoadipate enol-lactonase